MDTPTPPQMPSSAGSRQPYASMSPEQLQADLHAIRSVLQETSADKGPHRTIIAAANLFCAAIFLLVVPIILVVFSIPVFVSPQEKGAFAVPLVGLLVILILLFFAAPFVLAAWGLFKNKRWGEAAAIVAAVLNVWNLPLGTALSVYTFWAVSNGKLKPGPSV